MKLAVFGKRRRQEEGREDDDTGGGGRGRKKGFRSGSKAHLPKTRGRRRKPHTHTAKAGNIYTVGKQKSSNNIRNHKSCKSSITEWRNVPNDRSKGFC